MFKPLGSCAQYYLIKPDCKKQNVLTDTLPVPSNGDNKYIVKQNSWWFGIKIWAVVTTTFLVCKGVQIMQKITPTVYANYSSCNVTIFQNVSICFPAWLWHFILTLCCQFAQLLYEILQQSKRSWTGQSQSILSQWSKKTTYWGRN